MHSMPNVYLTNVVHAPYQCTHAQHICWSHTTEDFLSLFPISMQKWEDKHLHHRERHVSEDLPQGGLEIPCILSFEVASKEIREVKKLVTAAL